MVRVTIHLLALLLVRRCGISGSLQNTVGIWGSQPEGRSSRRGIGKAPALRAQRLVVRVPGRGEGDPTPQVRTCLGKFCQLTLNEGFQDRHHPLAGAVKLAGSTRTPHTAG